MIAEDGTKEFSRGYDIGGARGYMRGLARAKSLTNELLAVLTTRPFKIRFSRRVILAICFIFDPERTLRDMLTPSVIEIGKALDGEAALTIARAQWQSTPRTHAKPKR
jgi:hypothetical protein